MREAYSLVWSVLVLLFRSRVSLEAEILILRHQLNIQRRHQPKGLAFSAVDRLIFVGLYRLAPPRISQNRSVIRMRAYAVRLLRLRRIEFSVHTGALERLYSRRFSALSKRSCAKAPVVSTNFHCDRNLVACCRRIRQSR
jgi:hypothetical protein